MLNCVSTEEGTRITVRSGNFGAPNRTESGVQTSLNDWRHIWMFACEFPQKKPLGFVIQSMLTLKVSVFLSLEYWIWSIQDYQMNLFISISHLTSRSRRIPLVRVVESTKYLNKLDYAAVFLPVLLVISGLSKSNRIHSGSLKADLLEYDKDALVWADICVFQFFHVLLDGLAKICCNNVAQNDARFDRLHECLGGATPAPRLSRCLSTSACIVVFYLLCK